MKASKHILKPKRYLRNSFRFVFLKIMRTCLYTWISCSLRYESRRLHETSSTPIRVISKTSSSLPRHCFPSWHIRLGQPSQEFNTLSRFHKVLTDELMVTWYSDRRNGNPQGWHKQNERDNWYRLLHKWRLNLNNNTRYILSFTFMRKILCLQHKHEAEYV